MTPTITAETPLHPEVGGLLAAADRRAAALYPAESRHGSTAQALVAQRACFYVVRLGGLAVGCGGFVAGEQASAELKRIFVEAGARGMGLGRLILITLEGAARDQHIRTMRLETGVQSVEAIGLYTRFGYTPRGPFGTYAPDPLSVFMEKTLG